MLNDHLQAPWNVQLLDCELLINFTYLKEKVDFVEMEAQLLVCWCQAHLPHY